MWRLFVCAVGFSIRETEDCRSPVAKLQGGPGGQGILFGFQKKTRFWIIFSEVNIPFSKVNSPKKVKIPYVLRGAVSICPINFARGCSLSRANLSIRRFAPWALRARTVLLDFGNSPVLFDVGGWPTRHLAKLNLQMAMATPFDIYNILIRFIIIYREG